jgi:hypothetical protein
LRRLLFRACSAGRAGALLVICSITKGAVGDDRAAEVLESIVDVWSQPRTSSGELSLDPPTNVGVDRVVTGQMPSDLG